MKKIFVLSVLFFAVLASHAQQPETPAARLAHKIADKMKDSLGLDNQQRAKVFAINMELSKQKIQARGKSQDRAIVGKDLQRIEGSRDTLYHIILRPEQYVLYKQKKKSLVNNN